MKRAAGLLVLVMVVSLFGASDVRGGFALLPAGKTKGPGLTATIVTDVTGGQFAVGKGLTSIKVQRSGASTAALFTSGYVNSLFDECTSPDLSLQATTASRFTGLIDAFVDTPSVLNALFQQFGTPTGAAILDQDNVACTAVDIGGGTVRQILSFTAAIQFQQ